MIARGELTAAKPPWTGTVTVRCEFTVELGSDEELQAEEQARDRAVEIVRQALKDASTGRCPKYAVTRELLANTDGVEAVAVEPD